jgi:hypothetical protein
VADDPPQKLIDKMAKTFRDKNGDVREVMRTMLTSDEFFSQAAYRAKVKTPFEMIVSAVRATGAQVDFAFPLARQIADLGEPLYRKLEPTGYSDANSEWVNSAALLARMNFALSLAQSKVPGSKLDVSQFSGEPAEVACPHLVHRRQTGNALCNRQKCKARRRRWWDCCSARPISRGDDHDDTTRLFLKSSGLAMFGIGAAPCGWRAADGSSPRRKSGRGVPTWSGGRVERVVVPFGERTTTRCAPQSQFQRRRPALNRQSTSTASSGCIPPSRRSSPSTMPTDWLSSMP